MRSLLASAVVVVLAVACSPSNSAGGGSGSVSGTLLGKTFTTADAAASLDSQNHLLVALSDASGLCDSIKGGVPRANSSDIVIILPASVSPGTYASVPVSFNEFDATCKSPAGESGSGTVNVTSVSPLEGTFSFSLNSDSITGRFEAPSCNVPASNTRGTCM